MRVDEDVQALKAQFEEAMTVGQLFFTSSGAVIRPMFSNGVLTRWHVSVKIQTPPDEGA